MLRVRRGDKGPRLNGQEGVLSHESGDALMIHQQAAPPHGHSAEALRPLPPVPADRATYTTAARWTPSSFDSSTMLSHCFNRVTAYWRKGFRKLAHTLLGHLPPSWCRCANVGYLKLEGQSTCSEPPCGPSLKSRRYIRDCRWIVTRQHECSTPRGQRV